MIFTSVGMSLCKLKIRACHSQLIFKTVSGGEGEADEGPPHPQGALLRKRMSDRKLNIL